MRRGSGVCGMAAPVPGEGGLGRPAPAHCPRFLSPLWQREVDRNQELLTRIRQLQEREAEAEERMKEQLERHRRCRQSLDAAGQKLREKEDGLAAAGEVRARPRGGRVLRGRSPQSPLPAPAPMVSASSVVIRVQILISTRGFQLMSQTLS